VYRDKEKQREYMRNKMRERRKMTKPHGAVIPETVILKGAKKKKMVIIPVESVAGGVLPFGLCPKCRVMNYRCVC
jgi:hypothetical protein